MDHQASTPTLGTQHPGRAVFIRNLPDGEDLVFCILDDGGWAIVRGGTPIEQGGSGNAAIDKGVVRFLTLSGAALNLAVPGAAASSAEMR